MTDNPDGRFERLRLDGGRTLLWARRGMSGPLLEAGLRHPGRLLRERGRPAPGRGPVAVIAVPGTRGDEAVLKRYRRGGVAGKFLPDRFPGTGRFRRELLTADAAHRRGLPVPQPLALIRQGRWGCYRVFGLTRRIPAAHNLLGRIDFLRPPPIAARWTAAAAAAVRRLHDSGLRHADLSLGNFLVSGSGDSIRVCFVDLAGARMGPPLTPGQRRRDLRRLRRSWAKQCLMRGVRPGSEIARFLCRYCGGDPDLRRALRGGGRWTRLLLGIHRIGWRLPWSRPPAPIR